MKPVIASFDSLRLCSEVINFRKWTIAIKTTGDAKSDEAKGTLTKAESGLASR